MRLGRHSTLTAGLATAASREACTRRARRGNVGRLLSTVTLLGAAGALLVACTSGSVASGLTEEQTVGRWSAGDGFSTQLDLAMDGTLSATDWPMTLGCDGDDVFDVDDLRAVESRDFSGSWESYGGSLTYQLTLSFATEVCPRGGATAYIWRNGDSTLDICIKVSPEISSDLVRRDQLFALTRDQDGGRSAVGSCR